jgi:putative transposase
MARLLRIQFTGAIYHVTARGNERRAIYKDDRDRERFLKNLAEAQQLHGTRLYLVCLMPNHFHLLAETPGGNLSAFMARLLTAYAVYYNRRHQRVGHLTQGRYKAQLVEGNDYLLKLSRYIHLNPVCGKRWEGVPMAERMERLQAYRWSTFRSYAEVESAWPFVDYGPVRAVVEQVGVPYSAYVQAGLAKNDTDFQKLYREAALSLGSEDFAAEVKEAHQQARQRVHRSEDVSLRRVSGGRAIEEVLAAVAREFGTSESALRRRSRHGAARGAAAWALIRHAGLTQRAAAEVLGMGTGAAVSQQVAKWRRTVLSEGKWQTMESRLEQKLAAGNF